MAGGIERRNISTPIGYLIKSLIRAASTLTAGPMVVDIAILLR
jgi:hypothetical protein